MNAIGNATADVASHNWRITRRSLGACAPKRYSAQGRRRVFHGGTTGLPVGLHMGEWDVDV